MAKKGRERVAADLRSGEVEHILILVDRFGQGRTTFLHGLNTLKKIAYQFNPVNFYF